MGCTGRTCRVVLGALALLAAAASPLCAGPDFNQPWNPATPLPRFLTRPFVDPSYLTAVSKYRSLVGHSFSDNYEPANRSLKNYFQPRRSLLGSRETVPVFAPATGTLVTVTPEGHILPNGEFRGYQLSLVPDGYPAFEVRLFHVSLAPGLAAGSRVTAGAPLGFADLRNAVDFDWAVGAAWNAPPLYGDPGQVLRTPGYRLLSPFEFMTDELFAAYSGGGVRDRNAFVVPMAYRDTHPVLTTGGDLANFDPEEYVILSPPEGPQILSQPVSRFVKPGEFVQLYAQATIYLGLPLTYQWKKDGVPLSAAIPGARDAFINFNPVTAADMGAYSVTISSGPVSTESAVAVLTVDTGGPSRLVNVSTRGLVRSGEMLTPGFVLRGTGAKSLVVRGVGPTLGESFGLAGALGDPQLELIPLGAERAIAANDNWTSGTAYNAAAGAAGAFALAAGSRDAAMVATLAGADGRGFTVRVGASDRLSAGLAMAEVYDPEPLSSPVRIINVSTRGFAGLDSAVLTPGFVIGGTAPKQVLVRAVGPGLAPYQVSDALADPRLTITPLGRNFTIAANDDWGEAAQTANLQAAFRAAGAFELTPGSKDAALVVRLPPGGYTVQVAGANRTTGVVLVEIYDLDP